MSADSVADCTLKWRLYIVSDVNKDLALKATTKDLGPKAKDLDFGLKGVSEQFLNGTSAHYRLFSAKKG